MTNPAASQRASSARNADSAQTSDWLPSRQQIVIGKDILELLSTSMYVDAMTIYREYVQNAADAIDEARDRGLLASGDPGKISIDIDATARTVRIRDNGTGIAWPEFAQRLSNLGASAKRGQTARGFRGVGRLAGLGYCQELIFRSRVNDQSVAELRWDCRALKAALRSAQHSQNLVALVQEIVTLRQVRPSNDPPRYFEVEMRGVIRHRDDRLLNPHAVSDYLSQVGPVPFSPDFKFGKEISAALQPHVRLGEVEIQVNGKGPLYRPHRNVLELSDTHSEKLTALELHSLTGQDGELSAIAWILHHGYSGAIPSKALVKGLRLRTGNIQVGDNALLEELFSEPRFNGWTIGEVHVIDPKIYPNGRRDHFEQSVHFDNLLTQLTPVARDVSQRCRHSSIGRKWIREFDLHKEVALDKAKAVARGGISKAARQSHVDGVAKSLKAMEKVLTTRHIGEDTRAVLTEQSAAVEARVRKLMGTEAQEADPLASFKPQVRHAYEHVISLIYECSTNRAAAASIVEKLLNRIAESGAAGNPKGSKRKGKPTKHRRG
jgi:hypothetical protein